LYKTLQDMAQDTLRT